MIIPPIRMKKKTASLALDPTPAELLHQLRVLLTDAERSLAGGVTEESRKIWSTLRDRFGHLRNDVDDVLHRSGERLVVRARRADTTIRDHPYEALAISLGVGLLLGVFLRRD